MTDSKNYDAIIIGGSYAGLSAGLALGRALRKTLIIDSGKPCNLQTPHSHNFLTQDGETPKSISSRAKQQVEKYKTVEFYNGIATSGTKSGNGFAIKTEKGDEFYAKKIIFATGVQDIMPKINGFAACWGISVIHCPYCHGYEVKNEKTGILANGNEAVHYAQLINHWTKDLAIFTNGKSTLTEEETKKITARNIEIIEKEIAFLDHEEGIIKQIVFKDTSVYKLKAIYSKPAFKQHCEIPEMLGCELTEHGSLKVDMFQSTTVKSVFACGDNAHPMRSVANAVAAGNIAGAVLNNTLIAESF